VFCDTPTGNQYGPPSTSFSRAERLAPSGVRLRSPSLRLTPEGARRMEEKQFTETDLHQLWLVGCLLPVVFYLMQKKTVQDGIHEVFIRVKNEFMSPSGQQSMKHGQSELDQLEKLGALKEKGVITEDEFQAKKKQLLGL
jgi:hypothetical protein